MLFPLHRNHISEHATSSRKEEYGQSPQEPPQFEMKCEPNKFNHVVIQNTITTHTWAGVIIFSVSNTNDTIHITILLSVKGE